MLRAVSPSFTIEKRLNPPSMPVSEKRSQQASCAVELRARGCRTSSKTLLQDDDVRSAVWAGYTAEAGVDGGYKASIGIVGSSLSRSLLPLLSRNHLATM